MLGWEFPPFISGGLGTACHGLVCAMGHLDVDITMLLPMTIQDLDGTARVGAERGYCKLAELKHVVLKSVPSTVPNPYHKSKSRSIRVFGTGQAGGYDGNLVDRVYEYAQRCVELVEAETFDMIHAHDWVTYPAGIALQKMKLSSLRGMRRRENVSLSIMMSVCRRSRFIGIIDSSLRGEDLPCMMPYETLKTEKRLFL